MSMKQLNQILETITYKDKVTEITIVFDDKSTLQYIKNSEGKFDIKSPLTS